MAWSTRPGREASVFELVGAVGGQDEQQPGVLAQAVHLVEQLVEHAALYRPVNGRSSASWRSTRVVIGKVRPAAISVSTFAAPKCRSSSARAGLRGLNSLGLMSESATVYQPGLRAGRRIAIC